MDNCNQKSDKAKDENYICNPKTGRWVKKDGEIGSKILKDQMIASAPKQDLEPKQELVPQSKIAIAKKPEKPEQRQQPHVSASKIPIIEKEKIQEINLHVKLQKHQSAYYHTNAKFSKHLAMFDLDGTLIKPKSGAKYPKDKSDWTFAFDNVVEQLRQFDKEGFKIIIVSNQNGIGKGKISVDDMVYKLNNIVSTIGLPIEIYIATQSDNYRKPMVDMWNFILENNNLKKSEISEDSFYCGDAAGRLKNYLPAKPKDHNITDRYFAKNIGIKFYTPEEVFLKMSPFKYNDLYETSLILSQYYPTDFYPIPDQYSDKDRNLVILVGAPASGKSMLSKLYEDYVYLNNDTIKNATKLKNMYVSAIKNHKSVIIDNTNPQKETRKYYVDMAKSNGYKIYCYFFDLPKLLVYHLNQMRVQISHGLNKEIPRMVYNIYYSKLEKPQLTEHFDQIITIEKLHTIKGMTLRKGFDVYYYFSYDLS